MASIIIPDPSMGDLRAMLADTAPQPAKTETSETAPVEETEAPTPEPATETGETKQEPKEEALPEGVTKRIAKEVERASSIQRKIDEAVSARKAKEQELASITGKSGSDPAPTTAPVTDAKPTKPEFGKDGQTWGQYQEDLAKYESDHEQWLLKETRRAVEQEFNQRQHAEKQAAAWQAAVKAQGETFPALVDTAIQAIHEGLGAEAGNNLQKAVRDLDHWDTVAAHLGKNPAVLSELINRYKDRPNAAIAMLGRIEASLKTAPKTAAPAVLPAPPVTDGGKASASAGGFDVENASLASIGAHLDKIKPRKR